MRDQGSGTIIAALAALAAVAALAACGGDAKPSDPLHVELDSGPIEGTLTGTVPSWLGIPYAAPPVGPLRWKPPQAPAPWTAPILTQGPGASCPQSLALGGPSDTEDCLYLNVWTPPNADHAPVFVWLHGGAFVFGSGGDPYYNGAHLAQTYGAVIVTLNYRLGALGFLAHPSLDAEDAAYPTSGNYGLEDQFFALQWVQRNIAAFGGDPANVTLAGESAGGYSVCEHYLAARTHGLFVNAIAESGLCTGFDVPGAVARQRGVALADTLGCGSGTGADVPACLRAVSVDDMLDATTLAIGSGAPGGPLYDDSVAGLFFPNVDGTTIAQSMTDGFAAHQFEPRPLLLGTNKDEGTLFHSQLLAVPITDETEYEAALAVRFGSDAVADIVPQYPIASYPSPNLAISAVTGDAWFVCPARRVARAAVAAGAPTFRYSFQQPLEDPAFPGLGVIHSAEIAFVFGNDDNPVGKVGASGAALAQAMQGYWMRFTGSGDPNGSGATPWPAYDAQTEPYMLLISPPSAGSDLEGSACDLWDTIPTLPY
jgi:para-nitrobenzyl esterase|nr:carboxylesterase family protein [Kofleriaceae bacterium]